MSFNKMCFDSPVIILFVVVTILFFLTIYMIYTNNSGIKQDNEVLPQTIINKTYKYPDDPVREYDYTKVYDIFEEPTRRVARHEIPSIYLKRHIDYPTRGYPDNFNQFGILVKINDKEDNKINNTDENKILRLFGRQQYPGSRFYEYYTSICSGLDHIKIPLDIKREELYDGDIVNVRELGTKYKVQLHKFDAPRYYPDII